MSTIKTLIFTCVICVMAGSASQMSFAGEDKDHTAAGHSHVSPHGGVVVSAGNNHAELVVNSNTGDVALYVLGEDERTAAPINASEMTAQFKISGKDGFTPIKLTAAPLEGEKDGQSSRFSANSNALKGLKQAEVVIQVPLGASKQRVKFVLDSESTAEAHSHGDGHGHSHDSGPATIKSSVSAVPALQKGVESKMTLALKHADGSPVLLSDLVEVHTQKIHLLIVDPSLADYQHIHPTPTEENGAYAFSFTPKCTGAYLVFADLFPVKTKRQEYSSCAVNIPGESAAVDKKTNLVAEAGGLVFTLSFDPPTVKANDPLAFSVVVAKKDGRPFDKLEPIMGAFAHAVAFSEARDKVLHIHPLGREPEVATERGGPKLNFQSKFEDAGFWKLYIQVQVDGKDVFAPFGIEVEKNDKAPVIAKVLLNNTVCPITGKPIHSMQADAHLVYKDTRIELCCSGCEKTFMDAPEESFKKASESTKK